MLLKHSYFRANNRVRVTFPVDRPGMTVLEEWEGERHAKAAIWEENSVHRSPPATTRPCPQWEKTDRTFGSPGPSTAIKYTRERARA